MSHENEKRVCNESRSEHNRGPYCTFWEGHEGPCSWHRGVDGKRDPLPVEGVLRRLRSHESMTFSTRPALDPVTREPVKDSLVYCAIIHNNASDLRHEGYSRYGYNFAATLALADRARVLHEGESS